MKKNSLGKTVISDRIYYILFNFILFVFFFLMIGIVSSIVLDALVMENSVTQIEYTRALIEEKNNRKEEIDSSLIQSMDNHILVEFYDKEDNLILNLSPFEILTNRTLIENDKYVTIHAKFNFIESFVSNEKDYTLMVYAYAPTDALEVNDINVARIILFMDVTSETLLKSKIVQFYWISVICILVLGIISSIAISRILVKPILVSLQKQIDFVSDASHELKTPLAIMQSQLENVLSKSDQTVMDVSDEIAVSLNEVTRLNRLIQSLLTLSRSDKDTISLELHKCNLNEIISKTVAPFKDMAEIQEKKVNVEAYDIYLNLDEDKISQVMIILLDNALRYTSAHDEITIRISNDKKYAYVHVFDTGMGISDETKKKMFERFYREDKARSKETGGRGLGLAIAKALINKHHGRIWADHNIPKGTVLTFSLPLK